MDGWAQAQRGRGSYDVMQIDPDIVDYTYLQSTNIEACPVFGDTSILSANGAILEVVY